jgi:DNA modification methylase
MIDIHNEDFFEGIKQLPHKSIDLVVVDPPYCIGYKNWDNEEFLTFTERWIIECNRVLKDAGSMWSFMGYDHILDLIILLRKYGNVDLRNWVIWARQKGRCSSKHLKSSREDIIHFTKSKDFTWNNIKVLREVIAPYMVGGKPRGWFVDEFGKRVRWTGLGNVWTYTSPFWKSKDDKQDHPSQKPKMLIERLLLLSSNEGDMILDPFCGTGVVPLACRELNRNCIAFENNIGFYKKAKEKTEC